MDPNEFAQAIDQQGQIPSIVQEVARRKALAAVLDKATVTDTAGTAVDLDALVPQPANTADSPVVADADTAGDGERAGSEAPSDTTDEALEKA
jgi:trigger factor